MGDDRFTDNPIIGSIGNALGLQFITGGPSGAGAAGPSATPPPPNISPVKPEIPASRVSSTRESMAVRERYPQPRAAATTRGLQLGPNAGMNLPGVMSPDVLMHPAVQQLLGQYGLTPESLHDTVANASPNMFITNQSAYDKHPVLAGMLERGLEGAAFTHGSNTIGEGISNVAQGVLNAQAARADKYNNQLMMPFAQAKEVQDLQAGSMKNKLEEAQARYDQAHADYWDTMGDLRGTIEQDRVAHQQATEKLQAQQHALGYLSAHKDVPLNSDEQELLDKLSDENKGLENVPFNQLQGIYNTAIARRQQEVQKGKERVANIMGGFHARTSANASNDKSKGLANTDAKTIYEHNVASSQKFQSELGTYGVAAGPDGKLVYAQTPEAEKAATEWQKQVDDSKAAMQAIPDSMMVPGTGVTPSATPAPQLPGTGIPKTQGRGSASTSRSAFIWTPNGIVPKTPPKSGN